MTLPVIFVKAQLCFGILSSLTGFFKRTVDAKVDIFATPYFCPPFIQSFDKSDSNMTACVVGWDGEISSIGCSGCGAQIAPPVVCSNTIDMVYLWRAVSCHIDKSQPVSMVSDVVNANPYVSIRGVATNRTVGCPRPSALYFSGEVAGFRVIVKDALKVFLRGVNFVHDSLFPCGSRLMPIISHRGHF